MTILDFSRKTRHFLADELSLHSGIEIREKLKNKSFNLKSFPAGNNSTSSSTRIIVAVQIHNRPLFYSTLISSLRNAVGIDQIELVISSDYWSKEMNQITDSISFCRVHQVHQNHEFPIFVAN